MLYRSARSGGRSTQLAKAGVLLGEMAGDLQSVRPAGVEFLSKFFVELKTYEQLQWGGMIVGKPCKVIEFYEKAKEQALLYQKEPILIAKQNLLPIMVIMPEWVASHFFYVKVEDYVRFRSVVIFPFEVLLKTRYRGNEVNSTRVRLTLRDRGKGELQVEPSRPDS